MSHRSLREGIKKTFFWDFFPKCGLVGWLIPKQGSNPSKPPQITPKIAFFDPNFTFRFPKSYKNPGVGKQIWEMFPKKKRFSLYLPLFKQGFLVAGGVVWGYLSSTEIFLPSENKWRKGGDLPWWESWLIKFTRSGPENIITLQFYTVVEKRFSQGA